MGLHDEVMIEFPGERIEVVRYCLKLPWLPPSKNRYDGWKPGWKAGAKRKWVDAIRWQLKAQKVPQARRVGVAVRLQFMSPHRRDPQNYAQCVWNWVPDALVAARVIPDDDEGRVQIGPNWGIEMAVGRQEETRIALALEVARW